MAPETVRQVLQRPELVLARMSGLLSQTEAVSGGREAEVSNTTWYHNYYLLSTIFTIYLCYLPVPPPAATWRPRAAGGGAACPGPALTNQSEC